MIVVVIAISGAKLRADDPQVLHELTAHGAEAGDHETERALGLGGMTSEIWAHDGLSPLGAGIVDARGNLVKRTALADGFVDGAAGTASKAAQREVLGTVCVVHWTSAWTAGSAGHLAIVPKPAIAIDARAIEPGCVEVFSGLHKEADSDGSLLA